MNEVNSGIIKDQLCFVLFRLFALLPSLMCKLGHKRCSCKLISKTTAAYVYTNEQLRPWFLVLVRYFVILDIQL